MAREGPLWTLVEQGFLRVLARGGGRFTLDQMPDEMKVRVPSFRWIVDQEFWPSLKTSLAALDSKLRNEGRLFDWPAHSLDDGYARLTERLANKSPRDVGLRSTVRKDAYGEFLKRFAERLSQKNARGPRTEWEVLARQVADDPNLSRDPEKVIHGLMRLANEVYHYNISLLLSASLKTTIAVETQASARFDDLIEIKDLCLENVEDLPQIWVPEKILKAPPALLADIVDPDKPLGQAKLRWLAAKEQVAGLPGPSADKIKEMKYTAGEYSRRLCEHYRAHVNFSVGESAVQYFISCLATPIIGGAGLIGKVAGTALGSPLLGVPAGVAAGYAMYRVKRGVQRYVVAKYRFHRLKWQLEPPELVARSKRLVQQVYAGRLPSMFILDRSVASKFAATVKPFQLD